MKRQIVKGLTAVLCAAVLAPSALAAVPGMTVRATESSPETVTDNNTSESNSGNNTGDNSTTPSGDSGSSVSNGNTTTNNGNGTTSGNNTTNSGTTTETVEEAIEKAKKELQDWSLVNAPEDSATKEQINKIIDTKSRLIEQLGTVKYVNDELNKTITELNQLLQPASTPGSTPGTIYDDDDDDDDEDSDGDDSSDDNEDIVPANADHFLMVGGDWVTPTANAGENVSIVLPVVNMGKTMVTNAVVTPVLNTETASWPFEITTSNYSQTIEDLPGTDTGISDMDRRRELTWVLKTRSDVGTGYQKLSFDVRYRDSKGDNQTATLDTYVQLKGSGGIGADGKASVPRVIVTGFETNPEEVHAGESFMLTLHLKNTSSATNLNNILCEVTAAAEGKDDETTYAAFLPTAGSSTIFVDTIGKEQTKDVQIELEAKADLSQKPYAVDVAMSYEDEKVNSYTNTTSVSIPVKQEARIDLSTPDVMPQSISVGSEANVMFNIYNMGKTKLYNVQVKTESETLSGGDAFVGNLDPGATGAVDMYVTGQAATTDEGLVKLLITYEDEAGDASVIEKEITLFVSEAMEDNFLPDDMMYDEDYEEYEEGLGTAGYAAIVVGILVVVIIIAVVLFMKRKKKKEQKALDEDFLDLEEGSDQDSEE